MTGARDPQRRAAVILTRAELATVLGIAGDVTAVHHDVIRDRVIVLVTSDRLDVTAPDSEAPVVPLETLRDAQRPRW